MSDKVASTGSIHYHISVHRRIEALQDYVATRRSGATRPARKLSADVKRTEHSLTRGRLWWRTALRTKPY